jgi:hypothetical protein
MSIALMCLISNIDPYGWGTFSGSIESIGQLRQSVDMLVHRTVTGVPYPLTLISSCGMTGKVQR